MQATQTPFRTPLATRLIAAVCSALISTTLLGGVALAFDPAYAGVLASVLISATLLGAVVFALATAHTGAGQVGQALPARIG
ncbi:MAG: hypothetical protein AD742_21450 [Methylibium sp. NZG]|nr:MAG: hypothetical protein AD742_21450 [Methylibium sp. NZG]